MTTKKMNVSTGFLIYMILVVAIIMGVSCTHHWTKDKGTDHAVTSIDPPKTWASGGRATTSRMASDAGKDMASSPSALSLGLGRGAAKPVAKSPRSPRKKAIAMEKAEASSEATTMGKTKRRMSPEQDVGSALLTAGSFDDRLNMDRFMEYWQSGSLSKKQLVNQADFMRPRSWTKTGGFEHLQLSFVVDATGSMGDELNYLKREFKNIVAGIDRKYPAIKKEYSLIVYRDTSDDYVTRGMDFTSDLSEFQDYIDRQSAAGGGDYPEAVHSALEDAAEQLSWDEGRHVARMMFFIADAPPHDASLDQTFEQVRKLQEKRIAIYPVAASGVGDVAEEVMRATAVMTEGQYIFLTDDSGIGSSHAKPKFPCYHVEKLKDVMARMVADKLSGKRSNPSSNQIVRTVGNPDRGVCRSGTRFVKKH
jgi:hypothetical protein